MTTILSFLLRRIRNHHSSSPLSSFSSPLLPFHLLYNPTNDNHMTQFRNRNQFLAALTLFSAFSYASATRQDDSVSFSAIEDSTTFADSIPSAPRDVKEIISSLPPLKKSDIMRYNRLFGPHVFSGYHELSQKKFLPMSLDRAFFNQVATATEKASADAMSAARSEAEAAIAAMIAAREAMEALDSDSIAAPGSFDLSMELPPEPRPITERVFDIPDVMKADITPHWLRNALTADRIQENFLYYLMTTDPSVIDYAFWDLPVPPRLPEDDLSFSTYIRNLDLPEVDPNAIILGDSEIEKIHWLHIFNTGIQFSQAYVSSNWYQGGNNNLSLLFNFLWDVQLNPVYHPKFMLQSTLSYKLGLNSTPQDTEHAYSISEDLFQYNFKMGMKATNNWYYSFTTQFKTQILNSYGANSTVRKASFLSPADLNLGIGMTYSKQNNKKTIFFTASIAPLSYNLKTCIDHLVDPTQFGIKEGRKSTSEIGSSSELNLKWDITSNINYTSRMFYFSDYTYFLGDWENTLSFRINRFLTTQVYCHLRFDSSSDLSAAGKWKHWMMKEILSFGLSYSFSTK